MMKYNQVYDLLVDINVNLEDIIELSKVVLKEMKVTNYEKVMLDLFESYTEEDLIVRIEKLLKEVKKEIKDLKNSKYIDYLTDMINNKKITEDQVYRLQFQIDMILTKLNIDDPEIKAVITSSWGVTKGINRTTEEKCLKGYIKKLIKNGLAKDKQKEFVTDYSIVRNTAVAMKKIVNKSYNMIKEK